MRKDLAKELNIPEYKVKDVLDSYFHFIEFILRNEVKRDEGHFPTIGVPNFGKFYRHIRKRDEVI